MSIADQIDAYLKCQLGKIREGFAIDTFLGDRYVFQTSAGRTVDFNLEYTEHPEKMPSIVIYRGANVRSFDGDPPPELGEENHTIDYQVEGFIACDLAGTEGYRLGTDICVALSASLYFDGLLVKPVEFRAEVVVERGEDPFAIVKGSFQAVYVCPVGSE